MGLFCVWSSGATHLEAGNAEALVRVLLAEWSDEEETFAIDRLDPAAQLADLCGEVSADAVVLLAYGGPSRYQRPENHIVCGVAASDEPETTLHLACSTAL